MEEGIIRWLFKGDIYTILENLKYIKTENEIILIKGPKTFI